MLQLQSVKPSVTKYGNLGTGWLGFKKDVAGETQEKALNLRLPFKCMQRPFMIYQS